MRRFTILVCLTALAMMLPSASSAQTTVYDYDDAAAWWNAYGCADMKTLLPAYVDANGAADGDDAETTANHEKRVCVMYDMLPTSNKLVIERFIESTMTDAHANHKAWWNAQEPFQRQILGGANEIVQPGAAGAADLYGAQTAVGQIETTGVATAFDEVYDDLGATVKVIVDKAADALSGRGGMMTTDDEEEEAPALPLVGVGLLGLLLAGRGAWLRRRA